MSQDINLLLRQPLLPPSLLWGGFGIAVIVAAQVGYGAWLWRGNTQGAALETQEIAELTELRAKLTARNHESPDQSRRQVDLEQLSRKASAYSPLLSLVQQGSVGLRSGYLEHLTVLAEMSDSQVWITQVTLGNAGRTISLQGQAVDEPAVLGYRDRLNQAYGALGIAFAGLDLSVANTPPPPDGSGLSDVSAPTRKTVSFRLN